MNNNADNADSADNFPAHADGFLYYRLSVA